MPEVTQWNVTWHWPEKAQVQEESLSFFHNGIKDIKSPFMYKSNNNCTVMCYRSGTQTP